MTDNNVVVQAHHLSMIFKGENKKLTDTKAIDDLDMQSGEPCFKILPSYMIYT